MPTLDKMFTLTVTVEQFLGACSDIELQELDLLLPKYLAVSRISNSINSIEEAGHLEDFLNEDNGNDTVGKSQHGNISRYFDLG